MAQAEKEREDTLALAKKKCEDTVARMEEMYAEDMTRAKEDHKYVLDKLTEGHKRILTKEKDEHAGELDQASRDAHAMKMAWAEIKLIVALAKVEEGLEEARYKKLKTKVLAQAKKRQ